MVLRRATYLLHISIICAVVTAVAFGLIPLGNIFGSPREKTLAIAAVSLFWLNITLGQLFFWGANRFRKTIEMHTFNGKKLVRSTTGIKTFFSSKEARVFDIALIISLFSLLLFWIIDIKHRWLQPLCMTVVLLSFQLHCILNGRTYRYIKVFNKIVKGAKRNENSK